MSVIESSVDQNRSTSLIQPITGIVKICKNSNKSLHVISTCIDVHVYKIQIKFNTFSLQ